jgi:hypothetical protein
MMQDKKNEIKQVIQKAYIQGIHGSQEEQLITSGFHEDFNMIVFQDNQITRVDTKKWLPRIEEMKKKNPALWQGKTEWQFELVDVKGNCAAVRIRVTKNSIYFSTDYMLLYKFSDGWKIVSKIFTIQD